MALSVIIFLYVSIGLLAAAGSIAISRSRFAAKAEQIAFGVLLVPVAAVYLAFRAYFAADDAWRIESVAVVLFAASGILGMRLPVVLVLGYAFHGVWDLLHELHAHAGVDVAGATTFTPIPLAYGVFCAAYDWYMAVYFWRRRDQWSASWRRPEG